MRREIVCPGCGEIITVAVGNPGVEMVRESADERCPGRVAISVRGARVHQCVDGAFLPPDQDAVANRS